MLFIRPFVRGLRSLYMNASREALTGVLQTCRLRAKLNRWMRLLAPYVLEDAQAGRCAACTPDRPPWWPGTLVSLCTLGEL